MKALVLGATGATGQMIAREALAKDHDGTALIRSRATTAKPLPGLRLEEGKRIRTSDS